ncbi:MAG: DUF1587 domain-containing protein, partial [Polyangiales bacterium]
MHNPLLSRGQAFARGLLQAVGVFAVLALVACEGQIAGSDSSIDPRDLAGPDARKVSLGPAVGRRLNREEYVNSVEVFLGVTVDPDEYDLPRDERVPQGFRNSSLDLLLSPARVSAYDAIANDAVTRTDVAGLVSRYSSCTEMRDDCYDAFVNGVGL